MGLFDWFKRNKKSPLGSYIERDSKGRWIEVPADKSDGCCGGGKCNCKNIETVKATTNTKPATIPLAPKTPARDVIADMDKIEAAVNKRFADEKKAASAPKSKAKPAAPKATAKKPVSKSQEKRIAIEKDKAETPVAKKVVKKSVAPKPVTKPAPKATGEVKKAAPKKKQ